MYLDVIKGLLNSNLGNKEKLDKITKIVDLAEQIENRAVGFAKERNKAFTFDERVEPTWEDRLRAMQQLTEEGRLAVSDLDLERLRLSLHEAVDFLKRFILQSGAWRVKEPFTPCLPDKQPLAATRPLNMLSSAPWDIAFCISALTDWIAHVQPDDRQACDLILAGSRYLGACQLALGNGGVGDSFWVDGMENDDPGTRGNILETSFAVCTWLLQGQTEVDDELVRFVRDGVRYVDSCRNDDGGWGLRPRWNSDVKSTSMATVIFLILMMRPGVFSPKVAQYWKQAYAGLTWLCGHQNADGSWPYEHTSRDSLTSCSFYAIEAMTLAGFFLDDIALIPEVAAAMDAQEREGLRNAVDAAHWRALRWYEASCKLIKGKKSTGGKDSWGWWEDNPSSSVQNTAASLLVLLDTGWMDETSSLAQQAMRCLLRTKSHSKWWGVDTPAVIKATIRMLYPESRLRGKLKLAKSVRGEEITYSMPTGI